MTELFTSKTDVIISVKTALIMTKHFTILLTDASMFMRSSSTYSTIMEPATQDTQKAVRV